MGAPGIPNCRRSSKPRGAGTRPISAPRISKRANSFASAGGRQAKSARAGQAAWRFPLADVACQWHPKNANGRHTQTSLTRPEGTNTLGVLLARMRTWLAPMRNGAH
jgi:hypothetical protein